MNFALRMLVCAVILPGVAAHAQDKPRDESPETLFSGLFLPLHLVSKNVNVSSRPSF